MPFVYVHVLWFTLWIALRVERYPFGLLTMIVSLEAIFLSTFVMISQNRADEKRQVLADHEWQMVQAEERQNEQLLGLSNQILALTQAIHAMAAARTAAAPNRPGGADRGPRPPGSPILSLAWSGCPMSALSAVPPASPSTSRCLAWPGSGCPPPSVPVAPTDYRVPVAPAKRLACWSRPTWLLSRLRMTNWSSGA